MRDATFVRRRQSLRDLMCPIERAGHVQFALIEALAQRRAFEQLHDGVKRAALRSEIVDGQDVRVRQRGDGARLALESRQRIVRVRIAEEHFDGDVAMKTAVARAPHLAHPARADPRDDFIRAELRTDVHSRDGIRRRCRCD